jgi:hypothetical protein
MASAVTSNLPAAAPVPYPHRWLSPRVSISRDVAADPVATTTPEPAISKDFIDFEFSLGGSATMLPADELFADGKLLPLRKVAPSPDPAEAAAAAAAPPPVRPEEIMPPAPSSAEPIKPLRAAAADGADPYVLSPKAPSCSGRWRELLGLKRAADARSPCAAKASAVAKTPAPAARSAAARSLKLLLHRNTGRAPDLASAPLLRDSSDSEASLSLSLASSSRFSHSSSSSSSGHDDAPRLSLDSAAAAAAADPPRFRLARSSHSHSLHRHSTSSARARRRPSPPALPRCLSVDSPRMNSSGKIVFQGLELERSSSSPCSFHAAAPKPRFRAVDRSYSSACVRVAPVVLNVSVCPRPVFGFFKDRKDSSARSSSLGRRAPPPQGWSGELVARSSG